MASSDTDDDTAHENRADFLFTGDPHTQVECEEMSEPIVPPKEVVRAGRRFRLTRWSLVSKSGKTTRTRFVYRLVERRPETSGP